MQLLDKTQSEAREARIEDPGNFKLQILLVIGLALLMYLAMSAYWPKFSRAEVFFAECSREMLLARNFITPLYHGHAFFDKPILTYWLIIAMFKIGGIGHLTARIPSVLAALGTVALTGTFSAALFGKRAGLMAAMVLASSFMFFSFACLCMSDMLLLAFETLTMCWLYMGIQNAPKRTLYWAGAAASMGLAFVTKGPVGMVLPAAAFGLYLLITRQLGLLKPRHFLIGGLVVATLAIPWFMAAYQANGMGAIVYFFIRENLQRFAGSTYDTHKPIWFMLVSMLIGFLPWSIFLPFAALRSWSNRKVGLHHGRAGVELYLWLCVAVVIGFFSLSHGKCDYYALPAYPAAAALVGAYLAAGFDSRQRTVTLGAWGLSLLYLTAGAACCYFLPKITGSSSPAHWFLMPLMLCLSGLAIGLAMSRSQLMKAYTLAFAGICLAGIGFSLQVLPAIGLLQPTVSIDKAIIKSPRNTRIAVDGSIAHWIDEITFQTGREPIRIDSLSDLEALIDNPLPMLAIIPQAELDHFSRKLLSKVQVLDSVPSVAHSLTPGYALQKKGALSDVTLALITKAH